MAQLYATVPRTRIPTWAKASIDPATFLFTKINMIQPQSGWSTRSFTTWRSGLDHLLSTFSQFRKYRKIYLKHVVFSQRNRSVQNQLGSHIRHLNTKNAWRSPTWSVRHVIIYFIQDWNIQERDRSIFQNLIATLFQYIRASTFISLHQAWLYLLFYPTFVMRENFAFLAFSVNFVQNYVCIVWMGSAWLRIALKAWSHVNEQCHH